MSPRLCPTPFLAMLFRLASEGMECFRIKIEDLRPAPHCPPSRLKLSRCEKLRESILEHGLLTPLLVAPDLEIIDGHRRWVVVRDLGWDEVIVVFTMADKHRAYADTHPVARRRRKPPKR